MGFNFAKCARCDALFTRVKSGVCPKCQPDEEADFRRIRDALDEHSDLTAEALAEAADVTVACVLRVLDEGLIENVALAEPAKCGRCGAPAISLRKRLCLECLKELNADFAQVLNSMRLAQRKPLNANAFGVDRALEQKRRT